MSSSEAPQFTVRSFHAADLDAIKRITVEAFSGVSIDQAAELLFGPINGHDWKWRKARHIDTDVAREVDGILVAESDQGQVVGYITSWQDAEAGIGYIPNLAFVPEWRGRGLGRLLIQMILDRFRDSGLSHAKIETLANNEVGHHLYTSIGFHEVTRQAHFFADLDQAQSANESASESSNTGDGP
jgi:ribosomal protein S18 acetylase RimI-like enzyme